MPVDYAKGFIYKWVCDDLNVEDSYVGSSTNFNERKRLHKYRCTKVDNPKYEYPLYKTMREKGGFENWTMVLIEKFKCEDKHSLEARERFFIEQLKPTLNQRIPTRTDKEYRDDNKETLSEKSKIYRTQNKEKIQQIRSEIMKCECGSEFRKSDRARHDKSAKHKKFQELPEKDQNSN